MIKIGIIGGAGYTAGELIRLLINHPQVEISFIHSSSNAGNKIADVHCGLVGETELVFSDKHPFEDIDALFLCSAHGDSKKFIEANNIPSKVKIIDLSTDYRHKDASHDFVYGLPELNKDKISKATRLANPGCFATAIQLAILPLAANGMLKDDIHINAITGSTGAGVRPSPTTHFSWRDNNISIYKPFEHQHEEEIKQSLMHLQHNYLPTLNFIPVRGNFSRGIYVSAYTKCDKTLDEMKAIYASYYKDAAFTFVTDKNPDLKQVVNTNKCLLYLEKHGDKLLVVSMIDNLLKGASGQAVHNLNLMFGFDQWEGLHLKPSAF
ncbi:N-acetyl-gamma-glutamyl-phosphate reductase [Bacteroidales bacterium]|nr:N-acetyl-gamma-glutamyl-phosphate reductase [Bacteroidales bacterium]